MWNVMATTVTAGATSQGFGSISMIIKRDSTGAQRLANRIHDVFFPNCLVARARAKQRAYDRDIARMTPAELAKQRAAEQDWDRRQQ